MENTTTTAPAVSKDYSSLYVPGAIIIAALIIGGGLFLGLSRDGSSGGDNAGNGMPMNVTKKDMVKLVDTNRAPALMDTANVAQGGERFIGRKDAPLTVTYWYDYQCPFCQKVEKEVIPSLVEQYVNTGKIKIVFKDYAFLGQDSIVAAEYARAVWDLFPDKFYLWQSAMFDVQDGEGDQGFGDEKTIQILTGLIPGIDVKAVAARVASNKEAYDAAIAADQKAGTAAGVQGTPGFKIGTKLIDGAQPLSAFVEAIDARLQ